LTWLVVGAVAAVCVLLRVAAPLLLQGRSLPGRVEQRLEWAIPPLLSALVAIQLFDGSGRLSVDARTPALLAAGVVFVWRRSMLTSLVVATLVAAAVRAVAG
jgi:branched-subunit amino acid transport protein